MKLRLEGTQEELTRAKQFYESLQSEGMIKFLNWSKPYRNRDGISYRVYVELEILGR